MKKVAVLYIATGKYVRLWPGFLESAEKYLLKSCKVEYFVFTDVDHLAEEKDNPRIHRIFQEPMLGRTRHLLRFEIFPESRGAAQSVRLHLLFQRQL